MLPQLQIHSQHVECCPSTDASPPAGTDDLSAISEASLSSHQLQKPRKGKRSAKTRLGPGGSSSPSQQHDGIPVEQPVAPSSAHAGSAPLLDRGTKSDPWQLGRMPWLQTAPREPLPARGQTGTGEQSCNGIQEKIPSGRKYSKPLLKEIIKLLSDGRGRVSHPLEKEMPLAHEMMPLAFHPPQQHELWLGKAFPVLKLVP